jgi:hypothetical protein
MVQLIIADPSQVRALEKEVGLEWCVAGLERCGGATATKDAYMRIAYRIVRHHKLGNRGVLFVEEKGLLRLASLALASAVDSRLKVEAELSQQVRIPTIGNDRRRSVDHSLAVAVSVVLVDTAVAPDGDVVYIFQVLQGEKQIWHVRKQFSDFADLDQVMRPFAVSVGIRLPDLPSRWTIGKGRLGIGPPTPSIPPVHPWITAANQG